MLINSFDRAPSARSRRAFGRLLAGSGLALATMPLAAARGWAATQPIFYTWETFGDPTLFDSYVAANGTLPVLQTFSDENEAYHNLSAGMQADVVHPCTDTLPHWRDAGLLQPLDVSRLTNWPDLLEPLRQIPGINEGGQQWFVPLDWGTTSVIYRSDLVEIEDESYNLLWDERYVGKLALGEDVTESVIMAALASGITDPFEMSDGDLAIVRDSLVRQRDLLRYYWSDPSVIAEDLKSGSLVASSAWSETYLSLKQEGVPVKYMNPKQGVLSWCCGLVLMKSAAEVDQAYKLIDYLISPEAGAWAAEQNACHANRRALEMAQADGRLPFDPVELLSTSVLLRASPRLDDYQQMFDEVRGES